MNPVERESYFYHSVHLNLSKCRGCLNCIKRCPTQAIRVNGRKATIIADFCIDCGECIRRCPNHARIVETSPLENLKDYDYNIAVPSPTLGAQFNNLMDMNVLLTALTYVGFQDVFEYAAAAEISSGLSEKYVDEHPEQWPLISTACPTVVRLIRIKFPNLISHLMPYKQPMEIAADIAREQAVQKTGLPPDRIGVFFISPCPSEMAAVQHPLGLDHSNLDGVIAIRDIYPLLLAVMPDAQKNPKQLVQSSKIGMRWSMIGGESKGQMRTHYVAADGIENVVRVLGDLEDEKLSRDIKFIELRSCPGGCVGGVLNVENPYVASAKLARLADTLPEHRMTTEDVPGDIHYLRDGEITYEPVYQLGSTMMESMLGMASVERMLEKLPGLDCGMCGCPTCRCMAEDTVRRGVPSRCVFRGKNIENGGGAPE